MITPPVGKDCGRRLSIVIITYNGAAFTDRLLGSLGRHMQLHPEDEIVVVDNASTDNTREILERHRKSLQGLRIVESAENLGVARGRILGIKNSAGRYILLLDNDTVVTDEAIESLVSHMESTPGCGLAAPALRSPKGELQESAKEFPGIGVKIRNLLGRSRRDGDVDYGPEPILHPYYVIGACQIFARDTYEAVGGLDADIFFGPEDADFCQRVRTLGLSVDYIQTIGIIHDWQRSSRRSPLSRQSRLHIKALLHFYIRHRRIF